MKKPMTKATRSANESLPAGHPKLILNPSRQAKFAQCVLLYHRLYNLMLDKPDLPVNVKSGQPLLGTLLHATQAAYDTGKDYKKAVAAELKKLRASIHYNIKYAATVDRVEREAIQIFRGGSVKDGKGKETKFPGYPEWRQNMAGMLPENAPRPVGVEIVDVEKRLWVDVGPVVLAPKLDCVLKATNVFGRGETTWWVEEHKSTGRDDSAWKWRWTMDGQTTCQIVAAEQHYDVDFEGVLVNQVVVTRQKPKDKGTLPPINKVIRYDARWVSKRPEVKALYMDYLEDLAQDFKDRSARGSWPATGMMNRHCDLCHHKSICSGRESARVLQPVPPDELQLEFERRSSRRTTRRKK